MTIFGSGHQVVTSTTRPTAPIIGQIIYQTDTDEYLKYVSYGGANRWMQADVKSNRRLNDNGDFSVWQRGGGTITTNNAYLADRYQTVSVNSTSRSTDVPSNSGFPYSISFGNSSISYSLISHKIEASEAAKAVGKRLTISFWAKNVTGSVPIYVDFTSPTAVDNWGGTNIWDTSISVGVVPTSTWTYYTFTSSVVAPASVANGLGFFIPRNNGAATTLVTGIQLEVGTAPSEFEFESVGNTLLECQRYYATSLSGSDFFANSYFWGAGPGGLNNLALGVAFPRSMRIVPTLAVNFINFDNSLNAGQTVHASGFTQYYRTANGGFPYCGWRATYTATAEL